ncbi:MAG: ergothioneine biosynthesis protein EgtB [Acidimicrobiales bacterium]
MSQANVEEEAVRCLTLQERYDAVRSLTESLAAPLSPEDQVIQSMPDVSPTKWHRGHTSWFFETFLLQAHVPDYVPFDRSFPYIFNSYYESLGTRHPRAERGLISRPSAGDVTRYRHHVDAAMAGLLGHDGETRARGADRSGSTGSGEHSAVGPAFGDLVELGLHHEQQHQELLIMDIKHVLWSNPVLPAYTPHVAPLDGVGPVPDLGWIQHPGGVVEIGHGGDGFAFDNEMPRHVFQVAPFDLADRPVTCREWLAFMEDGGYERPELWLSDGWRAVQENRWSAPLYWTDSTRRTPPDWHVFTLGGLRAVEPSEPVCHVSYFEADAFAHWAGARLPTEAEWEAVAGAAPLKGHLLDHEVLHPRPVRTGEPGYFGDVWEWTQSAYSAYPGFRVAPGAVGEYNGKFMVNQYVLRGGSCATPRDHIRATYRNFFPAGARWPFSGLRLARDLEPIARPRLVERQGPAAR